MCCIWENVVQTMWSRALNWMFEIGFRDSRWRVRVNKTLELSNCHILPHLQKHRVTFFTRFHSSLCSSESTSCRLFLLCKTFKGFAIKVKWISRTVLIDLCQMWCLGSSTLRVCWEIFSQDSEHEWYLQELRVLKSFNLNLNTKMFCFIPNG